MVAANFNLRNISPEVMVLLKKEAAKQKISINSLILQIIEREVGFSKPKRKTSFHDLDHLAGTWSDRDKEEFDERIKTLETIDQELWS